MNARTLIILLAAAASAGCIDNDASVRISAACFPPTPNDDGSCSYASKCDSVWMGNLAVDPSYGPTEGTLYWPFQADNQRPANSNSDGSTNTASAFITGFKIDYFSSTVSLPSIAIEDTTRLVEVAGSQVLSIPVIPWFVALQLRTIPTGFAEVRAEIRATGHYGDGQKFETGPFSVVVTVANATWSLATCADPTQNVVGYCPQQGQSSVFLCK